MRKPTFEQIQDLLEFNPDTGGLTWRASRGRVRAGTAAGTLDARGYVMVQALGRKFQAHRLAWLLSTGAWPTGEIDHRDGNRANNRLDNLRDVSHLVNLQNQRKAHANSASGFLGVSASRGRWLVQIRAAGKRLHIGRFDSPEEANAAYLDAKREIHDGCTT